MTAVLVMYVGPGYGYVERLLPRARRRVRSRGRPRYQFHRATRDAAAETSLADPDWPSLL